MGKNLVILYVEASNKLGYWRSLSDGLLVSLVVTWRRW